MNSQMTPTEIAALDEAADLVEEALSQPLPAPTGTEKDRLVFERSIAARRAEKAKQQEVAAAAAAKIRQLTVSIHSLEAALDSLLASEA
jgi:hypothetical protein